MGQCSARRHLRGADFAVYDAAMQLTAESHSNGEKRILFASRETLSEMTGYSQRTVGFARIRLERSGWLRASGYWKQTQRRTGAAGKFQTVQFEVIGHEEWAESHPERCQTGYLSTACGASVDGETEYAKATQTVHGRTAQTVHGQQVSKALVFNPKSKPKKSSFVLPEFIPRKTWECFVEQRAKSKKPMTDSAMKLVCDKLRRLSGGKPDIAKRILEQSVERGWMSVFPLPDEQSAEPEEISDEEFNRREMERLFGAKESDDQGIRRKREQEQKQRVS